MSRKHKVVQTRKILLAVDGWTTLTVHWVFDVIRSDNSQWLVP